MTIGKIAFLGSGETSRAGGVIFERLVTGFLHPPKIVILETPAGFETNSQQVAGRVADFMGSRLVNYRPEITLVPARKRGTPFSPDEPAILIPLLNADLVFMGPGSPTYAIRQLQGSLAWELIRARQRLGAALVFASSASIAVGMWGLPVYEIYKVGEDVHSVQGLDIFSDFGLHASFIPHWNNAEGGDDLDTSRCFIGRDRFDAWHSSLPPGSVTVGLDEHTWLLMDVNTGRCDVGGVGTVAILKNAETRIFAADASFPLAEIGLMRVPDPLNAGISDRAWRMVNEIPLPAINEPSPEILALLEEREKARAGANWVESDRLRVQLEQNGWRIQDTKSGQKLTRI
jgi:hypothetical protein